jgi:hypothetical protein
MLKGKRRERQNKSSTQHGVLEGYLNSNATPPLLREEQTPFWHLGKGLFTTNNYHKDRDELDRKIIDIYPNSERKSN